MPSAAVTSKGQITIPVDVRRDLALGAGSRVAFVRNEEGYYELHPEQSSVTALKGIIAKPEKPVSLAEMDAAIARETSRMGR